MTPREWMDRIGAIPGDASIEERSQQFDTVLGELMDAWPVGELTPEEYSADVAVLRQYMAKPVSEIAPFLLGVSEYHALWVVPLCVRYVIHDHGIGLRIDDPWNLQNHRRFVDGWTKVVADAYRSQDKK